MDRDQIDLEHWRDVAVGYPKTIFVTSLHARSQFPTLGSIASSEDAARLASSVFGILMSAYDDESWVGFDVISQARE